MSEDIERLKEAEKENEYSYDYATEEEKSPGQHSDANWVPGIILIAIGVIFLFTNLTGFHLDNWWALFIMIPAVKNFGSAWNSYQRHGRFTKSARGSITGGLILTLVASAFLFGLDWGLVWPFFLIIGGVAALFNGWFD
ncbi:MAG: hypothetical protein H6667_08670 [Ardenticatenaceae bacterium]|nr:hypothetical protein [Ardenticatenaceae bacterium]